jgi:hypothetical protein
LRHHHERFNRFSIKHPQSLKEVLRMKKNNSPVVLMLLGMVLALGALVALFTLEFRWIDLAIYLPALAAAAVLIFMGRARGRREYPPAGKKQ